MEITAEQMDAIRDAAEALKEIFENLKEKFRELCKKIVDVLTPYLQKVMRWARDAWRECLKAHARQQAWKSVITWHSLQEREEQERKTLRDY